MVNYLRREGAQKIFSINFLPTLVPNNWLRRVTFYVIIWRIKDNFRCLLWLLILRPAEGHFMALK